MSPRIQRTDSPLNLYHVLIVGNNNEKIFLDDEDKQTLIDILFEKAGDYYFDLYAYCVMDNHTNLLIKPKKESLSELMRKINMVYANYFNRKYERSGHVFHDRFKSKAIADESIILPIIGYIHYNPVLEGICDDPNDYHFSSAQYFDDDQKKKIAENLNMTVIGKDMGPSKYFQKSMCSMNDLFYYDHCYVNMDEIAKKITKDFLRKRNLTLETLRQKGYCDDREYLILLIRKNTGFSIRKISELLGINRGEVYRIIASKEKAE